MTTEAELLEQLKKAEAAPMPEISAATRARLESGTAAEQETIAAYSTLLGKHMLLVAEHARIKTILDEAVAFEVAQRPSPILTVMLARDKLYHAALRKMDEAVSALRLRSIFVGHPGEPFYMDGGRKVFHWKPEYELADAAQALAKDLLK